MVKTVEGDQIINNIFRLNQHFFLFQRIQACREGYWLHHNNLYIESLEEKHALWAVIGMFPVSLFQ